MELKIFSNLQECLPYRTEWNQMAGQISDDVSLTFEWHWALWKSHLQDKDIHVAWLSEGGKLEGILPFYVYRRRIRGVPLDFISLVSAIFSNHDSVLLKDNSLTTIKRVLDLLKSKGYLWHAFACSACQGSDLYAQVINKSTDSNWWVEYTLERYSPYLPMNETPDEFLNRKSSNFRYNLRRKTRSLEKKHTLEFLIFTDKKSVDRALNYLREIEKGSWKETSGTSITSRQWEEKFYTEFSLLAADQEWLRIYIMLLDGKPIAYDYGVLYKNRYFMLKTSYMEHISKLSPGIILRWKVIKDLYMHEVQEHDFLGESEAWKMSWTENVRHHASIIIFNPGLYTGIVRLLGNIKQSLGV